MKYLGVSRAELYSPGRVSGDAAIFRSVAAELVRHGHEVSCMTEQELVERGIPAGVDGIFQMCRSARALDVLRGASVPVINSVDAVTGCSRATQVRILQGTGLVPESMICSTDAVPAGWHTYPCGAPCVGNTWAGGVRHTGSCERLDRKVLRRARWGAYRLLRLIGR